MGYWGESGTTVTWKNPTKVPEGQRQSGGWYYNPDSNRVDRWWAGSAPQPQQSGGGGGGGGGTDFNAILKQQQDEQARKDAEARAAYEAAQARGTEYLGKARAEEESLMGKFTSAVQNLEPSQAIYQRLGAEQGLPGLKTAAEQLTSKVKAVPGEVKNLASQFAISAPRQAQRVTQMLSELAPAQQEAVTQFQNSVSEVSRQLGFALDDQKTQLQPFSQAFAVLSDRISREMTGFTNDTQNRLNLLLDELKQTGSLATAKLNAAYEMAKQEADYLQKKDLLQASNQITEANGRKLLINMVTGEVVADLGSTSSGKGTSGINFVSTPPGTINFAPKGTTPGQVYNVEQTTDPITGNLLESWKLYNNP